MVRRFNLRRAWLPVCIAVAMFVSVWPASAQSTGLVKGTVKDEKGQPVEGAKITIEFEGGVNRKFEGKTDKHGEFIQIGLQTGEYKITAEKDKLAATQVVRVRLGTAAQAALVLGAAAGGGGEAAKKLPS